MTNEVEKIILEDVSNDKISYQENVAYLAYKEIWKFILHIKDCDFTTIKIRFNVDRILDICSINETDGIKYEVEGKEVNGTWNTYYEGSNHYNIKNIMKTSIDINLLLRLLYEDGFYINHLDDDNKMLVYIEIKKYDIEKCIRSTLLRNKVLKLEKVGNI